VTDIFRAHLGDTPLSNDEIQGLIPNLATQGELNEFEYKNIVLAQTWALDPRQLANAEILNASYLLDLHKRMFNETWRWAGKIRKTPKTIGVEPHSIATELAALFGDVKYWIEHKVHPADEIALRFHHRLVFIHPFSNGNGRHARLVADVFALKLGQTAFSWGVNTGEAAYIRQTYLESLRRADQQDYAALFAFARSGRI
jgi:Fic-DOC domain mobile mystery protein B